MKLKVLVRSASSRQEVLRLSEKEYKVFVTKPAYEGKANKEVERLLSKHFRRRATIVRGLSSSVKQVEVSDAD